MSETPNWIIESLDSTKHHRDSFTCGIPALDDYLQKQALLDSKRDVARVFVLVDPANPFEIIGYYTLNATSFQKQNLPAEFAKKLPHYPVPAALIGRFAIHTEWQGKRIGKFLLMSIFELILLANETLAVHAIIVDAKNEQSKRFYEKYGFIPFDEQPLRLFLPLTILKKLKKELEST